MRNGGPISNKPLRLLTRYGVHPFMRVIDKFNALRQFLEELTPLFASKKIGSALITNHGDFLMAFAGARATATEEWKQKWIVFMDSLMQLEKAEQLKKLAQMRDSQDDLYEIWGRAFKDFPLLLG
jgi:hypothetical protein